MNQFLIIPPAKIMPPSGSVSLRILERKALVGRLIGGLSRKLTLIIGSGGTGKTTLLSQALPYFQREVHWINLDRDDTRLLVFVNLILSCIQHKHPEVGEDLTRLLSRSVNDDTSERGLSNMIDSVFRSVPPFIMILDDFNLVSGDPQIARFIENTVELLPEQCHLILTSCHFLSITSLNRWRIRQWVTEFQESDLLLSAGETEELIHIWGMESDSPEFVQKLHNISNGWIGLYVLIHSRFQQLGAGAPVLSTSHFDANSPYLLDFITDEVISGFPEEIREFILPCSLFDKLVPAEIDAILEREDSGVLLERLQANHGFVSRFDAGVPEYGFHEIFKRGAYRVLTRILPPEDLRRLNLKIGLHLASIGEEFRALSFFFKASEHEEAIRIMTGMLGEFGSAALIYRIGTMIADLPEPAIRNHPRFLLIRASLAFRRKDLISAIRFNALALERFSSERSVRGMLACHSQRADLARLSGDHPEFEAAVTQGLRAAGKIVNAESLYIEMLDAIHLRPDNTTVRLEELLEKNRQCYGSKTKILAMTDNFIALSSEYYRAGGQLLKLAEILEKQIPVQERYGQVDSLNDLFFYLAICQRDLGQLDMARTTVERLIRSARMFEAELDLIRAIALQVEVLWMCGEEREASSSMAELETICNHRVDEAFSFFISMHLFTARVWDSFYRINPAEALVHSDDLIALHERAGFARDIAISRVLKARILCSMRRWDEARVLLGMPIAVFEASGYVYPLAECRIMQTMQSMEKASRLPLEDLKEVLSIIQQNEMDFLILKRPERKGLLTVALEHDIQPEYVTALLIRMEDAKVLAILCDHKNRKVRQAGHRAARALEIVQGRTVVPGLTNGAKRHEGGSSARADKVIGSVVSSIPLEIRCFGAFKIIRQGDLNPLPDSAWRTARSRQVFKYLLLHRNQPVSQEKIVDTFWPDDSFESGISKLYNTITFIRRALEPKGLKYLRCGYIQRTSHHYILLLPKQSRVDYEEFNSKLIRVKCDLASGNIQTAKQIFFEANDLYRGEFLPENLYDEWTEFMRQGFREAFLDTGTRLARKLQESNAPDEVIRICNMILARDPLSEQAVESLMKACLASNQKLRAIQVYRVFEKRLKDELNFEPDAYLKKLFYSITR